MQQIIVIEPIVTDRLILKALVKEDASAILHILSDRETAWWSDDFKMRSLDEAIDFIDWGNEAIDVIHYGLFRKESEKAIGYIQIKLPKCSGIKDARKLGYALSKNFRKQGYQCAVSPRPNGLSSTLLCQEEWRRSHNLRTARNGRILV
ncbi:MAG: GNAT family N-acetyltransferase [Candidatus Cryptobacteroides sp.]|nr:GNAT family N-acetyltransferase [Candidatus Cryptobacteroides sp.]